MIFLFILPSRPTIPIFGFINVFVGVLALLFSFFGNIVSPEIRMFPLFSEAYIGFIVLPCFILSSGVIIILRMEISRIYSVMVSCVSVLYLCAVPFLLEPPGFIP